MINPIRVLIVSSDNLARTGLTTLISNSQNLSLSGQTDDASLFTDVELYQPDIVVWDLSLRLERLSTIRDLSVPVIAIVADNESAVAAWSYGARGILSRDVKSAKLIAAIEAVVEGLNTIDISFIDVLASSSNKITPVLVETLTERELQVLHLVAEGLSNKLIATKLGISEHTVKFHVNSILTKTGALSRTQAVTVATRIGLIKL
jgi:two-component system, NarL family, nitrate/nitrite response regulator NarL